MADKNSQLPSDIKPRPPIVAVLGHVDHGKTTLLDKIRKTSVASREAGGITQSIGAWQAKTPKNDTVTFIDTPGHEAFRLMRERGAKIADIVVLVVAADDGVMPQTKESLKYINDSQTPFLVAITKVDLPTAQIEKAKNQLMTEGVLLEGYGGDVPVVEVSAKTGQGLEDLLEMITLMAEINEVSADPEGELEAYVIESRHDRRKGVVVSAVVKNGSLKAGDLLIADDTTGKARVLFDEAEKPIQLVLPGTPVEIIGFSAIPAVGSVIKRFSHDLKEEKTEKINIAKVEGFPIVLRADTSGSLEAILPQIPKEMGVLYAGVGDINESDVLNASTAGAAIVGFNVRVGREVEKLSEGEHVKIYTHRIIYELLQNLEKLAKGEEEVKDKILGKAEIMAQFPHDKLKIAGCRVAEGRIAKSDRLRLLRGTNMLGNIRLLSLKKQKMEVDKVTGGDEFGILFEPQFDFQVGDVIESYQERQAT